MCQLDILVVSVDVKPHWTMHTHWWQFVPDVSTRHPCGFCGRKATLNHAHALVDSLSLMCQLDILVVSVDVKPHWTMHTHWWQFVPETSVVSVKLDILVVSVDVKPHWTMHTHWWQFVPDVSTRHPCGFCGRKATLNHAHALVTVCPWCVN